LNYAYEWTTLNGVNGGKFTDRVSGNSIFLPDTGCRYASGGTLGSAGYYGFYWSGSSYSTNYAWGLGFSGSEACKFTYYCTDGYPVRCVFQ